MTNQAKVMESHAPKAMGDRLDASKGCSMYKACPICFRCEVYAPHLYRRCDGCQAAAPNGCTHTEKQRSWMIRRENFRIKLTNETAKRLVEFVEAKKKSWEVPNE